MRLGVDIDGCLADFNSRYIALTISRTGKDLFPPRPFDITTWSYPESYGYTKQDMASVWHEIRHNPYFWESLPRYEDVPAAMRLIINAIQYGHDLYFITSRPGMLAKKQTENWLAASMADVTRTPPIPTVLISSEKGLACRALELDAYVDDRWENALDVSTTCTRSYLLNRPWNTQYAAGDHNIVRVDSVSEFLTTCAAWQQEPSQAA